jgi:hypothetical protein
MRRAFRILVTLATVLSSLLCVATVSLCVRSRWMQDWILLEYYPPYYYGSHEHEPLPPGMHFRTCIISNNTDSISIESNRVFLEASSVIADRPALARYHSSPPGPFFVLWANDQSGRLGWLGFHYASWQSPVLTGWTIGLPHWLLALIAGALPGVRVAGSARRRYRKSRGRCPKCTYDLRATPDRCPECGMAPATR